MSKEFQCVCQVSDIFNKPNITLEQICQEIVDVLLRGLHHNDISCAKITIGDKVFKTKEYLETKWKQTSDIRLYGVKIGSLDVCYLEDRRERDEGPSLKEEEALIGVIAERLGKAAEMIQSKALPASSEQRLQRFMDEAPFCIALFDSELNYTDVNKAVCEINGLDRNQIVGKHILEVNPGLKETGRYDKYLEVLNTGETLSIEDMVTVPRFGHLHFWVRAFRITDGLAIISVNITKQVEEKEQVKFQSYILNQVSDSVIAIDNEHRITYWNNVAENSYGVRADEAIGQKLEDVYSYFWLKPEDERDAYQSLETEGIWRGQNIHILKNGKKRYVESTVSVIKAVDGTNAGLLAVIRDLTKRKQAEETAVALREELERRVSERTEELRVMNQRLRTMATQVVLAQARERRRVATLLHDSVNQNLASYAMKLQVLMQKASSTEFYEPLNELYNKSQVLIKEVRSLTSQLSPPVLYEIGLEAALEELVKTVRQDYGLKCVFHTDGEVKHINKDMSILLYQIVHELLTNVIKHAKAKRIGVESMVLGDEMRIIVADDGIGLDLEIIHGKKRVKGFGLFSIRELLKDIGGRIEAETTPTETRIVIAVPVEQQ